MHGILDMDACIIDGLVKNRDATLMHSLVSPLMRAMAQVGCRSLRAAPTSKRAATFLCSRVASYAGSSACPRAVSRLLGLQLPLVIRSKEASMPRSGTTGGYD